MLPAELASGVVLEAFAATVSYRLEPDGQATRFPVVLDRLLAGRLAPSDADAALVELDTIERELRALPAARVVFSLANLSIRDLPGARVNRSAPDAFGYFVAEDDRPLAEALREGVLAARAAGRPLGIRAPGAAGARRAAWALTGIGVAWAVGAKVWLPNFVVVPHGAGSAHGPALWSIGLLAAGAGGVQLAAAARPAFASAIRGHGALVVAAGVALTAVVFVLTWR